MRNIRAVFRTEQGRNAAGLRSTSPWVFVAGDKAICERCETVAKLPDPPSSMGLNQAPEPLFSTQSDAYALFLVSSLSLFHAKHEACSPKERAA